MPEFNATVLIPTYNRVDYISEAIDSILAQTIPPMQIIVVDDGCTDGTDRALSQYGNRIEVYRQANSGKSFAINAALPQVRGDYLWIFDDDDIALPDALEKFARAFRDHPDAGFVYSSFDEVRAGKDGSFQTVSRTVVPDLPPEKVFIELLYGNFIRAGPSIVAKTACYREVGPFNEVLIRSLDYDMWLRLSRRYAGVGIKNVTFLHRLHDGQFGSVEESVSFAEKHLTWLKYDRLIVTQLYEELETADYVPERRELDRLSPEEERLFRIRRSAMMATNGLWEPALADLEAFVALFIAEENHKVTDEEAIRLRLLMRPRYAHVQGSLGGYVADLRRILARPACAPIRKLLKSELWRDLWRDLRRLQPRRALRTLRFCLLRL